MSEYPKLMPAIAIRGKGFSLIELMVTLSVLAILLFVAAPSFSNFISSQRIKTASFDVIATLSFARSEAIKQNGSVTITPTGGSWGNGWLITGPDGSTLKTQAAFQNLSVSGPASLVFGRSGRVTSGTGNIQIDNSQSNAAVAPRCITIDVTGLPRSRQGSC